MPEKRMKYDREFRKGAVRIVNETNSRWPATSGWAPWVARDPEAHAFDHDLDVGPLVGAVKQVPRLHRIKLKSTAHTDPLTDFDLRLFRYRAL